MTKRDELIEKVARAINNVEAKWIAPTPQHVKYATAAIDTIYTELQASAIGVFPPRIQSEFQRILAASPLAKDKK